MKKNILFFSLLALQALNAIAGDLWFDTSLTSYHINAHSEKFNTKNYGIGIEYKNLVIGEYWNSYNRTTDYAAYSYAPLAYGVIHAGVALGIMRGYPTLNNGGIAPMVAGIVKFEGEKYGANILVLPPAVKNGVTAIGLQIKFKVQ